MDKPLVELAIAEGIADLRITRPDALNAINADMAADFLSAVCRIEDDPSVRVVKISSEGRAFMAGGDIASFKEGADAIADNLIAPMSEALDILANLKAPVVGCVQGAAAGAGMSLALACDIVIAADNAKFTFAYGMLGASCDLGISWHLPRAVGLSRALTIALLSDAITAHEAHSLGFVYKVVPIDQLEGETNALVKRLADSATVAMGAIKSLFRLSSQRPYMSQMAAERDMFKACAETQDFKEGVEAFLTKRRPKFIGS
ncbi:enoyl-CoA hydratase/isomerase family protein [Paraburkholderia sp. BR14374]|uniref:enoyl-CoA hydratase/isomerase family protein n=1 Tax=Paraburkholderia sp. BR14374 TaxID=3237007 RepID=UPI0034CE403C